MSDKKKQSVKAATAAAAAAATPEPKPPVHVRDTDDEEEEEEEDDWSESADDEPAEPTERSSDALAHERVSIALMSVFDLTYPPEKVEAMSETDLARARAVVTKTAERMLKGLGVDAKRFYSGALQEVVRAHELGGAVLGTKLQGPDVTTKDGAKVELKDSNPAAGERTNFCFPLPKKRDNETDDFYYKRVEGVFMNKGTVKCVHHSHTGKDYEYVYDPRFLAFYVQARGLAGKSKFNIGAVPCRKCNKVHRMCRLLELQTQWHKNSVEQNKKLDWALMLGEEVKQNCD